MGEDSGPYATCAEHCCQTFLTLERPYCRSPRTAADGRQHLGNVRVCELRTADQEATYTRNSLLHATALPIDGLHLKMGLHVVSFHGEIRAEALKRIPSI
jgi:hypothetical protein